MSRCNYIFQSGKVCNRKYKTPNESGKCSEHFRCIHKKELRRCRLCKGQSFCKHDIRRTYCDECGGGDLCIHKQRLTRCEECGGSEKCEHKIYKNSCRICDFIGYITGIVNKRIRNGYVDCKFEKEKGRPGVSYLGCNIPTYIEYLNNLLAQQNIFTWENYGTHWQIDHIIPLYYNLDELTEEIFISRFHYTNTQPLSKFDNNSKGSRFIG